MADYSFVVNSQFNPFSYQELLAPVHASTLAHQDIENAYSDLETKASVWEGMANQATDINAYNQYRKYADDLRAQAGVLASQGLTPASRAQILDMKRRYASEIIPIENAYNTRREQAKAQQEALVKDPTHMFARRASNISLDEYMKNPNLDTLSDNYSGALLTQQASQAAAHLAKELRAYGKGQPVDAFTNTFLQQHGYSSQDVGNVIAALNNPGSEAHNTILGQLANDVLKSSGIEGWNDPNLTQKALGYIGQGLYSAVGESSVSTMENKPAVMAAQYRQQLALENQKRKWAREEATDAAAQSARAAINPQNIYSQKEKRATDKEIDTFKKYFYKDSKTGEWKMTWAGKQRYDKEVKIANDPKARAEYAKHRTIYNESTNPYEGTFKGFVDKISGNGNYSKGFHPGDIGKHFGEYIEKNNHTNYDATKLTEYAYDIDTSDMENWGYKVSKAAANGKLSPVDWDNKKQAWKAGSSVSIENAFKDDGKVSGVQYSAYGVTFTITDKNKKTTRYSLPAGINPTSSSNAVKSLGRLSLIQSLYGKAKDKDNIRLTVADKMALEDEGIFAKGQSPSVISKAALADAAATLEDHAMFYISQLGNTNTNKPSEWGAVGF